MVTTSAAGVPGPRAGVGAAKDHAIVSTQGTTVPATARPDDKHCKEGQAHNSANLSFRNMYLMNP